MKLKKRLSAVLTLAFAVSAVALFAPKAHAVDPLVLYAARYSSGIYGMTIADDGGVLTRQTDERDIDFAPFSVGVWSSKNEMPTVGVKSASVDGDTLTVDFSAKPVDVMWCHELTARMSVATDGSVTVTVKLTTTEASYEASTEIEGGADYMLIAPLDSVPDDERLTKITFTASNADKITVSEIYADNRTTVDFIEKYLAAEFKSADGNLSTEYGKVVISPIDKTVTVDVSSVVYRHEKDTADYLRLTVSSATNGDSLTLTASGEEYGTVSVVSGTADYYFALPKAGKGSYQLIFDCDPVYSAYEIESAEVVSLENKARFVTESVGKVSDVKIAKSSLSITGSIASSAVIKYIDKSIAVYEFPIGTSPEDAVGYSPVAEFDISTQFSLTLSIADYSLSPETSVYAVAIVTNAGPVFIAEPSSATAKTKKTADEASVVGLVGATSLGIFESNAAHAVFDIDLASLTDEYLTKLDKTVAFCESANVNIHFCIYSSADLSEKGYTKAETDGYYPFDLSTDTGRKWFSDAFSAIVARYPNAVGFIYGIPANADSLLDDYGKSYADALTVMNNVLSVKASSASVYATVYESEASSPALADIVLSHYTDAVYGIAWVGTTNGHYRFISSQSDKTASKLTSTLIFVTADSDDSDAIASDFAKTAEYAAENGIDASFLVIPESLAESNVYSAISRELNSLKSARYTFEGNLTDGDGYTGKVKILDYSTAFSADGWLSGNGCRSITTELHGYFGDGIRSLEAAFDDSGDSYAGGVLIYHPSVTMHLSSSDAFSATVYAATKSETVEVTLTFSYGYTRYEYTADIEANKPITLYLDTHEIEDSLTLDYIAISVRADSSVKLNLAEASAMSRTLTDSEIKSVIFSDASGDKPIDEKTDRQSLITVISASAIALSAVVFLLLSKRKKEQ